MKILYFNCTCGISGDMVFNGLMNLGASKEFVQSQIEKLKWNEETEKHSHVSYKQIKELIQGSGLSLKTQDTALSIYGVIAKAEAKVHEATLEEVHFHEVGRNEAVKNIVGVAAALEDMNPEAIFCSEIHDGTGTIECSHGTIPVPVPAVMAIREQCRGYRFVTEETIDTEMVTPSGLGILAGIKAKYTDRTPAGKMINMVEITGKRDIKKGGLRISLIDGEVKEPEPLKPVKNESLLESIHAARQEASQENTVRMLNEVVRAKLLAPISLDKPPISSEVDGQVELDQDTKITFEMIATKDGDVFYPVFTHGEEMKKCAQESNQHSLLVNFEDLANMILNQQQAVKGFVINPIGENVCFTIDMIKSMMAEMQKEMQRKKQ